MSRDKGIIGLFMSFLMIASVFAVPMGVGSQRNTNNNRVVGRPVLNNTTMNNTSVNRSLNNTTFMTNNTTQRRERNRFRRNESEHLHRHGPIYGHHNISMRHIKGRLMRYRERIEHLIHKRNVIMNIHRTIKYELMPLMHRVRTEKRKAMDLKMELLKECGTNVSNYSKCNISLVDEYVNTTKLYLVNALTELKLKLEIMKAITNDTSVDNLTGNISTMIQEVESAKNISDLEALKPGLEEIVHETRIKLAEDALLMKFAVLSLFVDRSITMVKNIETRINNTTIDSGLQKIENSLLELQTEIANMTSSNLTTNYRNLSKEFVVLKTKYIDTMKDLRQLLIQYMKTRRMH